VSAVGSAPKRERDDYRHQEDDAMTWDTPEITEVCVGMEVTSYESAAI
jgi:coenzyme PQQ precursor peptide PqqA